MMATLDQGFWPDGLHTAPTDEALAYDLKVHKEMGFNSVRKHIKVEPDRWFYWADKLGLHGVAGHARDDGRGEPVAPRPAPSTSAR